jgi:hypothetical protein
MQFLKPDQRVKLTVTKMRASGSTDKRMLEALRKIAKAARSWHDFHHGSNMIQCDEICEALPAVEDAIERAEKEGI